MNVWGRSCLYRLWVIGGLAVVVGVVLYIGLTTGPGAPPPYGVIGAAVGVYLAGVILLQAVALWRDRPRAAQPEVLTASSAPPGSDQLERVLTLPGADLQRSAEARRASWRFSLIQFLPLVAVAILLPLGGYLYVSGAVPGVWAPLGDSGPGIPVAALPGLIVVVLLVLMLPGTLRRGRRISDDLTLPLGLTMTAVPQIVLLPRVGTDGVGATTIGPTVWEGERYGRRVMVQMDSGRSAVLVMQPTQPFTATPESGRLVAAPGAPAWVGSVLATIGEDGRFRRITVTGGPQGVMVGRSGSAVSTAWMLDLWLAERIAASCPA